jgi:integrase
MADSGVYDRWYRTVDGKRVPSGVHGQGKRWQARWRDDSGPGGTVRQRAQNFDRKVQAETFLAKVKTDLAPGGHYVDPAAGKRTLRAYGDGWLAMQTSDPSTREAAELRLRLHIFPQLGDYQLAAIRPSVVQAWTRGLQATLAPNYVRVIFANLSALLSAALDDGLIARNPCCAGSARPPAPDRRKVVPWPVERVAAVRNGLPDRYRALADLGAGLGLRQGEAFGLAVDDIDWLRGTVHVRRQVKLLGSKPHFALPKGGRQRDVPLPEQVALRLAAHLQAWPAVAVTLPWSPAGKPQTHRLISSTRERTALDRTYVNRHVWKPALEQASIPATRENGMHALRHHYATVLLTDGLNPKAVADWLGHADPGFTLRVYGHVMPSSEDRGRAAIDKALGGAGAPDVHAETTGDA